MDLPIIPPAAKITCRRCSIAVWIDSLPTRVNVCDIKKCWLKKPKALKEAAEIANVEVCDLFPPTCGKLGEYKDTYTDHHTVITDEDFADQMKNWYSG